MQTNLYVLRLGEISLKKNNRSVFEQTLKHTLKFKLRPYSTVIRTSKGRMFVEIEEGTPQKKIDEVLSKTFGIVSYSQALSCEKDLKAVCTMAVRIMSGDLRPSAIRTFKVETVRSDKTFEHLSYDISREVGHAVLEAHPDLTVDVRNPDTVIRVEIRDKAYIIPYEKEGQKGLPVRAGGKAMLMLSGGIDSPVAAWYAAKRGIHLHAVYFHAYPYTSDEAKEKVIALARQLNPYLDGVVLHIIPFTDVQLRIKQVGLEEEQTLLMRAAMVEIANALARANECTALVTGEALSQVASQTLQSLSFTDHISDLLILRPLIGFDKEEIITVAKRIGTFDISILPFEDCCTIFSPRHPLIKPDREIVTRHYREAALGEAIEEAIKQEEIITF